MKNIRAALFAIGALASPLALTQNPPAPTVDSVGFPDGYQNWRVMYAFDRPDNKQVRTIYANDAGVNFTSDTENNYQYGSIIVMETWASLKDSDGNPILDSNGRYLKDPAATPTLFVMRKEKGLGTAYGPNRNGEWEYVAYRPDKTYQTTPQNSFSCAICHLQVGQHRDWVFRAAQLYLNHGSGGAPAGVIENYTFIPGVMTVKSGSTITFYNADVLAHTITDDFQGGWSSPQLTPGGGSVALTFNQPGEFNFHCSIHPAMKGKIIVTQ